MVFSIYLAGGMRSDWQDRLIAKLPSGRITIYDPRSQTTTDPSEYTAWDLAHVVRADCIVSQMAPDNPSGFGLSVEVGYAYALGKPIIFIDQIQSDWRSKYFDMHRQIAAEVVREIDEAAEAVIRRSRL